jgi:DNA invertase Pin-like site-specific DNA recombinase
MQISDAYENMIYGYARVSTAAQDERGQVKQLTDAGCGKIFREKITGTTTDGPQLGKLMKRLAPGDVVITPAVDRLSLDTTDLLVIVREVQRAGAGIRSLAEPYLDTTSDFAEIVFAILGVAAKLERVASSNAPRAAGPMPRRRASSSAASRFSRRTSRRRPASASKQARRSAAFPAVTMSARARFHGSQPRRFLAPSR